jgi:hypothetical protein
LQSRKRPTEDDAGPSQVKKKVMKKKTTSKKKKKTPIKKKIQKATAAPPTTVVSSVKQLVFEAPEPTNPRWLCLMDTINYFCELCGLLNMACF